MVYLPDDAADHPKAPRNPEDDPFKPPADPIEVSCLHCGQAYMSSKMYWADGFWCCGIPGCDGRGFCFDVFPTDPEWTDEHGNKVWIEDDESEDESDGGDPSDDPFDDIPY